MLLSLFAVVVLVGSGLCEDLPSPRIKYSRPGHVEISFEDAPGVKFLNIQYGSEGRKMHLGPIHKAVDGRWYHYNANVDLDVGQPIKYDVTAEREGKVVTLWGIYQLDSNLAISPPQRMRRAGRVVFRDDFNLANGAGPNFGNWRAEVSMYGGHNQEVQVYTNDRRNMFIKDSTLFLKPTLTTDDPRFDENFLRYGVMDVNRLWGTCTNSAEYGCRRDGHNGFLPPVMSGKVTTKSKHTIRYGRVTVRAKIPKGDWIWPAIWMLPQDSSYGGWPRSGEIDIMESRGNTRAIDSIHHNHGIVEVASTLHWGPDAGHNGFQKTHGAKYDPGSYSSDFHDYVLDWTADHIITYVDNVEMMRIPTPSGGFFHWGGFHGSNPWHTNNGPFDKPFYLILNVAVGGKNGFFPDSWHYDTAKPWNNHGHHENQHFWDHRHEWLATWHGDDVAMQIKSVEMVQY